MELIETKFGHVSILNPDYNALKSRLAKIENKTKENLKKFGGKGQPDKGFELIGQDQGTNT